MTEFTPLEPEADEYPGAVGQLLREAFGPAYVDPGPIRAYPTLGDLLATAAAIDDRIMLYGSDDPGPDNWSTHEGFAANFGEPIALVPHLPRKPKQRKRKKR